MGGEQGLGNGRRRRIWREEGGPGEQALGDGRRRRGGSEREHGVGREGHGEEKPTRFQKRGVRLAFSDTLRATGDRGSAFATGH